MRAAPELPKKVVLDASLAVWAVLPFVSQVDAVDILAGRRQDEAELVAPMFWLCETASAVRALVHGGHITTDDGWRALEDLLALDIQLVSMSAEHMRAAFEWSIRLGQRRAYDGFYLALAEEIGAELWCADQRLVTAARQHGVSWVHTVSGSDA